MSNQKSPMQFLQEELTKELHRVGAIQFGAFKLKLHEKNPDAPLSPIYINLRKVRSFPGIVDLVAIAFYRLLEENNLRRDFIADVPTAATPFVSFLSYKTRIPMVSPRLAKKNYGSNDAVEGVFEKGKRVLLIDDLIVEAESKLAAIKILESQGLKVENVLVVIDREQGGAQALEKRGYKLFSIIKISTLLALCLKWNFIEVPKYEEILNYISKQKEDYLKKDAPT